MTKAIYIGVAGVARKVKTPYIGVDDKSRKVKAGYIGVNGVARRFYAGGVPLSTFAVGTTVKLNVNGSPIDFLIVHQGNPSSSAYGSNANGTWLMMKNIYEKRQWNSANSGTYATSTIHTYLNGTFLGLLGSGVQSKIKEIKIPYSTDYQTVVSGSNGLSAKIFLASTTEIGLTEANCDYSGYLTEGACLKYFKPTTTSDDWDLGIAYYNGRADTWWLRTLRGHKTARDPIYVTTTGYVEVEGLYTSSEGIRPLLVLPSDTPVPDDLIITG